MVDSSQRFFIQNQIRNPLLNFIRKQIFKGTVLESFGLTKFKFLQTYSHKIWLFPVLQSWSHFKLRWLRIYLEIPVLWIQNDYSSSKTSLWFLRFLDPNPSKSFESNWIRIRSLFRYAYSRPQCSGAGAAWSRSRFFFWSEPGLRSRSRPETP